MIEWNSLSNIFVGNLRAYALYEAYRIVSQNVRHPKKHRFWMGLVFFSKPLILVIPNL